MLKRQMAMVLAMAAVCVGEVRLEQVLGAAFPWEVAAARKANAVGWVVSWKGAWNVWVADGPEYAGRQVTKWVEEDGQEVSGLIWAGDGARLAFVRGGSANPASLAGGVEQAVYEWERATGAVRRVGEGRAPVYSPDGRRLVWLKGGAVMTEGGALFKARGAAGGLAFSPDGSKLAFSSSRIDHAFIGIYDFAGKTISYLDASTDRDAMPVWSPDGKRVAYVRVMSEGGGAPHGARRAATPWAIRVAEVESGVGKEVFRAAAGRGSVFQPVGAGPSLLWSETDELVFPWEKTGWKQLYAVPVGGGAARALTAGEFEVDAVAADGASVVVASNEGDIDRRHLWRVSLRGGVKQLTRGEGIEWAPAVLGDGSIALLRSDARRPARASVLSAAGGMKDLVEGMNAEFPVGEMVVPQAVRFAATDGQEVPGQLFVPRGLKAGERRPAVIFLHGGSRRQMLLGWHPMYYYHNAYAFNQYLAGRGYVVLSVNYRSGTGYGMEFREALDYGATGASEYRDVAGAGLYLRGRADVDGKRIGLWGGSYGGYLTAMGLALGSDLFAAGVDLHGVHDWARDIEDTRAGVKMTAEYRRRAFESSPMAVLDGWKSPVLLIHGDADTSVEFNQTVGLVDELRKRGVEYELMVLADEEHDFLLERNWMKALRAAGDFLDRKLRR